MEKQFNSHLIKHDSLHKSVTDLSDKVSSLSNQNQALQQSVEAIVSKFISCPMEVASGMESAEPSKFTASSHASSNTAAQVIIEELADREKKA